MKRKAIYWTEPGKVENREIEIGSPGPGELLLKNSFSLVSPGTEREWLSSDASHFVLGTTFPFIPGYSFAGYVLDVGEGVEGWNIGDPLIYGPLYGTHSSHIIADPSRCFKVSANVKLEDAIFFNLGMTAIHSIRLSEVKFGESIAIIGQGPIGLMATQTAKSRGANPIIAFELDEKRRKAALDAGATHVLDPRDTKEVNNLLAQLGGGVSVSVDLSGVNSGMNTALHVTKALGRVVFSSGSNEPQMLNYGEIFVKGLTIIGAFVNARMEEQDKDIENFLWMLSENMIKLNILSREIFNPCSAVEVYKRILENDKSLSAPLFNWSEN